MIDPVKLLADRIIECTELKDRIAELEAAQAWVKERPTKTGSYWIKRGDDVRVIKIWDHITPTDERLFTNEDGGAPITDPELYDNALWSGPITPPDTSQSGGEE